jgi:hypothetical protein
LIERFETGRKMRFLVPRGDGNDGFTLLLQGTS